MPTTNNVGELAKTKPCVATEASRTGADLKGHRSSSIRLDWSLAPCVSALALIARRSVAARAALVAAIAVLWIASEPAFAGLVTAALEDQNPATRLSARLASM
jgi:hypothetical protein